MKRKQFWSRSRIKRGLKEWKGRDQPRLQRAVHFFVKVRRCVSGKQAASQTTDHVHHGKTKVTCVKVLLTAFTYNSLIPTLPGLQSTIQLILEATTAKSARLLSSVITMAWRGMERSLSIASLARRPGCSLVRPSHALSMAMQSFVKRHLHAT